ncbi:unnamed protein product [Schistosoma curassoni]|uniref:C2H2-type domain-containing protein n=1 Tax=Schistosoma curassoni TaxID=6186 RepID=A0A183JHE7_9TREM|nr:unnamed protein product [Schistosoma curassoni]
MEIPVSDFCFGITCKVEQPMRLDGVICKSSNEFISNDLDIGLGNYIKAEECNYDNIMDDSLIDNKLGILRDNQSLYLEDGFKHKSNSNDGHIVNAHNRINGGTTVKRHQISSVQDSEKGIKYSCIKCDRKFSSKFHLIEHKKVIHEGINLSCDECDRNFTTKSQLTRHIQSIHQGIVFFYNYTITFTCIFVDFNMPIHPVH